MAGGMAVGVTPELLSRLIALASSVVVLALTWRLSGEFDTCPTSAWSWYRPARLCPCSYPRIDDNNWSTGSPVRSGAAHRTAWATRRR